MAFYFTEQKIGSQLMTEVSATQKHPIGTICRAFDPTYGEGEFIYLRGVANTLTGTIVTWFDADTTLGLTAFATTAVATSEPMAVAMAAIVADKYGWYQISGIANLGKSAALSLAPGLEIAIASGLAIAADTTNIAQNAVVAITASAASGVILVPVLIERMSGPGVN
jgi:predicted RecA/RadA family phage recombinase